MANLTALMIGLAIASASPVDAQVQTAAARNIDFDAIVLQMSHSCAAPAACAPSSGCCPTQCDPCAKPCCKSKSGCNSCCVDGYCCGFNCCGNWCGSCWGCPRHCWNKDLKYRTTTSDLYPHYWYYPSDHGYYSFRPYNWTHIEWARQALPGIDPRAPYSNDPLTAIQNEFIAVHGPGPLAANSDQIPDIRTHYPNVEDILNSRKETK
ncbi:hypothetical protein GC176_14065 [bacterium]|nr:hypothetical protein [bacterium]